MYCTVLCTDEQGRKSAFSNYCFFRLDTLDEENMNSQDPIDVNKLTDDYYVDILANTPGLDSRSPISKFQLYHLWNKVEF